MQQQRSRTFQIHRNDSNTSIVDKGWNLVSQNTVMLVLITVGFIGLLAEAAGFRPFIGLNDLLPFLPDEQGYEKEMMPTNGTEPVQFTNYTIIYKLSEWLDQIGYYTVHVHLATYILLPYAVITEKQKVLLAPWLVLSLARSVLRELLITLMGIVLCASRDAFYLPCAQYSALQGAQFCFTMYFWTSVHNFYHYLDKKNSNQELDNVIKTINRVSHFPLSSPRMSEVLSVDLDNDSENTEVTLVERAAMAWIAREILESDEEYVTDTQFSQFLAIKATMELRQALKELAEKKKITKKRNRVQTTKQKIEESLEYMKVAAEEVTPSQAFEDSNFLSRRDPIRRIRPLTSHGKPVPDENESTMSGISNFTVTSDGSATAAVQTEPPTPQMSRVLDMFEYLQKNRGRDSDQGPKDIF